MDAGHSMEAKVRDPWDNDLAESSNGRQLSYENDNAEKGIFYVFPKFNPFLCSKKTRRLRFVHGESE